VILDVLAGGDVGFAAAELVGDPGKTVELGRGQQTAGDFASHHLDASLALAVYAVFQSEGPELVFRDLAGEEGECLVAEDFDLFPNCPIMLFFKHFPL
jgi:hypothetical protein